jgi:hypothetical protein
MKRPTCMALAALALSLPLHAQEQRQLDYAGHVGCGALAMAVIASLPQDERPEALRIFQFFLASAVALDPARNTKDAATAAHDAMYRGSIEWVDSVTGKDVTDEARATTITRMRAENTRCLAVLDAYEQGIRAWRPPS